MKTPWEIKIGKIALYIAIASFVIGTILFVYKSLFGEYIFGQSLIIIGLRYILIAVFINSIYLLFLIVSLFFTKKHHLFLIQTVFIMLANIPVALFYFSILSTH